MGSEQGSAQLETAAQALLLAAINKRADWSRESFSTVRAAGVPGKGGATESLFTFPDWRRRFRSSPPQESNGICSVDVLLAALLLSALAQSVVICVPRILPHLRHICSSYPLTLVIAGDASASIHQ